MSEEPLIKYQKTMKILDMIKAEREKLSKKPGITIKSTATVRRGKR